MNAPAGAATGVKRVTARMRQRRAELALALICAAWLLWHLTSVTQMPHEVQGYEAERVARDLADGHGFSFPGNRRWLFSEGRADEFFPTAWTDPVFTSLLAGAFLWLGEDATRAVLALNALAGVACLGVLFVLVRRFAGSVLAVLAVIALAIHPGWRIVSLSLNNATWASLLIVLTAYLLSRTLEASDRGSLLKLGLVLGLTVLLCPAALLFLLVVPLAVLLLAQGAWQRRASAAALTLALACLVIAPWTIRNAVVFGEFVPVRTGAGQLAHVGTVALGNTIRPLPGLPVAPAWHNGNVQKSVALASRRPGRKALEAFQEELYERAPPPGYGEMNEAQRDAAHMRAALTYMRTYPFLTARMAVSKLDIYATRLGSYGKILGLLALAAACIGWRHRTSLALAGLISVYTAPYAVFVAYFHRYRTPIEPLLVALSAIGAAQVARLAHRRITRARHSAGHPPAGRDPVATDASAAHTPRTMAAIR